MRILTRSFALMLALCMVACLSTHAGDEVAWEEEPEYIDGCEVLYTKSYAYIQTDGQATITGYIGSVHGWEDWGPVDEAAEEARGEQPSEETADDDGHTEIVPYSLAGYPVVAIRDGAFFESMFDGAALPEGLASIGDSAFGSCYYIDAIIIPDGVTDIGKWAFVNCIRLIDVTIPESVTAIGEEAFLGCGIEGDWITSRLVLCVKKGSYAEQYAKDNEIAYTFSD